MILHTQPITVVVRTETLNTFARLNTEIESSNPNLLWMSVLVSVLRRAEPPRKQSNKLFIRFTISGEQAKELTLSRKKRKNKNYYTHRIIVF
jgi:hypothetical protein